MFQQPNFWIRVGCGRLIAFLNRRKAVGQPHKYSINYAPLN